MYKYFQRITQKPRNSFLTAHTLEMWGKNYFLKHIEPHDWEEVHLNLIIEKAGREICILCSRGKDISFEEEEEEEYKKKNK